MFLSLFVCPCLFVVVHLFVVVVHLFVVVVHLFVVVCVHDQYLTLCYLLVCVSD